MPMKQLWNIGLLSILLVHRNQQKIQLKVYKANYYDNLLNKTYCNQDEYVLNHNATSVCNILYKIKLKRSWDNVKLNRKGGGTKNSSYKIHRCPYILDNTEDILYRQWYDTWRVLISLRMMRNGLSNSIVTVHGIYHNSEKVSQHCKVTETRNIKYGIHKAKCRVKHKHMVKIMEDNKYIQKMIFLQNLQLDFAS